MSLLRRRDGPRIKYVAEEGGPYDTITVDKLTPIIGGEIAYHLKHVDTIFRRVFGE
jgi:taurine dioxygenase